MSRREARTFVLVHGAWHGGWCWQHVAAILSARGHRVSSPTLTGLGERSHLLDENVDLDTFVRDVELHLDFEDLEDVVLVGHSFGGNVVALLADRVPGRLRSLVFLDALLPRDGCSPMDLLPPEIARDRLRAADETSGGLTLPPPPIATLGLKDASLEAFVAARLTPHPLRSYLGKVTLAAPLGNGLCRAFVSCRQPVFPTIAGSIRAARAAGWPVHELPHGHDVMLEAPAVTAELLEALAA